MATFEQQIEGITSIDLTATSSPTQDEVTQFLLDGVKETVDRVIKNEPSKARIFGTTSTINNTWGDISTVWENGHGWINSSDNGVSVDTDIILSVVRENGTEGKFEPAVQISASNRSRAADPDSLIYNSVYNPGWYMLDGKVYVLPTPSDGANQAQVTYVTYGGAITYSNSNIANFPNEYEYLVVLYASIKALKAAAVYQTIQEDTELTNAYLTLAASLSQDYDKRLTPFVPSKGQES